ncbi:MAG TPA: acyltransferase [Beijerinckiaceae bacterium]|nr:acyltransferase [Beijerinckiaceae bacterium]
MSTFVADSTAVAPHRYAVLDAWRGICALLVTVVHIPLAHRWLGAQWFENMQMFVDFFFVLSGFVMCHAYGHKLDEPVRYNSFMIRRFGRIWPLHAAILAGFVLLELVKLGAQVGLKLPMDGEAFTGPRSVATLVSNVFLTQSFNLHGMTSWNGPAWSIGVEFYAYMVFGLVVFYAGMRTAAFAALATVGLAGVGLFAPNWIFTTHDYGFFRCLFGFFTGCLVYQAVQKGRPAWSGVTAEVAAVIVLVAFMLLTGRNATSLAAPIVFAGVVYVFAFERGPLSAALRTAPAQALGLWSYSIYMVHMLIFAVEKIALSVGEKVAALKLTSVVTPTGKFWTFNNGVLDTGFFAMQIALTLLASAITYRLIEEPARRWFARLADAYERKHAPSPQGGLLATRMAGLVR